MRKNKRVRVDQHFNSFDFHDDGLNSVKIRSLNKKKNSARIDFEFRDDSSGATKVLSFRGCGNLRYIMDFDVLASNWFAQTQKGVAMNDVGRMQRFVQAQMPHWHVTYMPPSPRDKPIRKKLRSLRSYVLFKVTFFGGTVEVLAKSFTFRQTSKA